MPRTVTAVLLGLLALAPADALAAPQGGRYALLVGVRQYDRAELTPLDFPENDVTVLAELLRSAGYRRVVLMTQTRGAFEARYLPTADNIRREMKGLLEDRTADDTVLVAFCGHGVQFADSDEPYFCPMDAQLKERKTLISLGEAYTSLKECKAKVKLLISDACRNDPLPKNKRAALDAEVFAPSKARRTPPENVVALFSCSAGEVAYESTRVKHGVFFHFLIEGLRGKAVVGKSKEVTLGTLADYVQRAVRDFVKEEVSANARQRPELVGRYSGSLALVEVSNKLRRDTPIQVKLSADALKHLKAGKYREAVGLLDRALKEKPDDPWALAMRAFAHDNLGDHRRALADANQALKIDKNIAPAYLTRGNVYLHDKKVARAITEFNEAIRRYPKHQSAHYHRGRAHAQARNWDEAIADYTEQLRIKPKDAMAHYARGLVHAQRKDLTAALRDFSRAIQLNEKFAVAYADRGLIFALKGDDTTALKDYNEAIKLDSKLATPYYLRGNVHMRRKDYPRAIDDYTEAIRRKDNYTAAVYNRGRAFYHRKDHAAAIKDLTEAIRQDRTFAPAYNARGVCHAAQNRYKEAVADYTRAIELDRTDPVYYANRGKAYARLGQKTRSAEDLATAKKLEAARPRKAPAN
jgi:tetratricopeptide (TPR) repeat protein